MIKLTDVFGTIVLLFLELYQIFATAFLYKRPESMEWNEQFRLGIRAIGALYVFLTAKTYRERHDDS